MATKQINEPDMALVGLLLLVIFGVMIWSDRPIQSPRPYDTPYPQPLDRQVSDYTYISHPWEDPFGFKPGELQARELYEFKIKPQPEFLSQTDGTIRLRKSLDGDNFLPQAEKPDMRGEKTAQSQTEQSEEKLCGTQLIDEIKKLNSNSTVKILFSIVQVYPQTVINKENRTRQRYAVTAGLAASGYNAIDSNRLNFCSLSNNTDVESLPPRNVDTFNVRWERFENDKKNVISVWIANSSEIDKDIRKIREKLNEKFIDGLEQKYFINDSYSLLGSKAEELSLEYDIWFIDKNLIGHQSNKFPGVLFDKLNEELKLRRVSQVSVALIIEDGYVHLNELKNKFYIADAASKNNQFTYFKGLDANQQNIKKQEQPNNQSDTKDWSDYFSFGDHHNPPIGHAQFDYLSRLAKQIKAQNKAAIADKKITPIKAIGIFGTDFYDKLIILQAFRQELPNLVYFTTDLDAEMLQPEYWSWTRNLIIASHFDLQLRDELQEPFPPFRDSLQTKVFYQIQQKLESENLEQFKKKYKIEELKDPPLIFEIGRQSFVQLEQNSSTNGTDVVHPSFNNEDYLNFYISFFLLITLGLIYAFSEIKPNSGAQTSFFLITATLLFGIIWLFAIKQIGNEPFSLNDGVSIWPTILIRAFTILLAVAFIIILIRKLEVNFVRLTRKNFPYLSSDIKTKTLFSDKDRKNEKLVFGAVCKVCSLLKKCTKSTEKSEVRNGIHEHRELNVWKMILSLIFTAWGIASYLYVVGIWSSITFFYILMLVIITSIFLVFIKWGKFELTNPALLVLFLIVLAYIACKEFYALLSLFILLPLLYLITRFEKLKVKSIQDWIDRDSIRNEEELKILKQLPQNNLDQQSTQNNNDNRAVIKEADLWKEYCSYGGVGQRLLRTTIMWLIFMNINAFLIQIYPEAMAPCRNEEVCHWYDLFTVISFSLVMFLIFLVLDAHRLCIHWIEKLRTKHPLLVDVTLLNDTTTLKNSVEKLRRSSSIHSLEELLVIVAKRTRAVDQLIYFPIIALILLLMSRIQYFDNLDFPLSSGIVYIVSISLLLYASLQLRSEASKLRLSVINSIEKNLKGPIFYNEEKEAEVITRIQEINFGAFQPIVEQPAVRSALLLLGAIGLFATEYIMLFGY